MFHLSIPTLLALAVIALVSFGPNEPPKIAPQAGDTLRDLRRIAEGANGAFLAPSKSPGSPTDNENEKKPG